jgi:hypothetical protein
MYKILLENKASSNPSKQIKTQNQYRRQIKGTGIVPAMYEFKKSMGQKF